MHRPTLLALLAGAALSTAAAARAQEASYAWVDANDNGQATLARPHGEKATTPHRTSRRRTTEAGARTGMELGARVSEPSARPRPSRVLAELHAALADEASAAE